MMDWTEACRPRRISASRQRFNALLSTTALVAALAPIGALPLRAQTVWTGAVSNTRIELMHGIRGAPSRLRDVVRSSGTFETWRRDRDSP